MKARRLTPTEVAMIVDHELTTPRLGRLSATTTDGWRPSPALNGLRQDQALELLPRLEGWLVRRRERGSKDPFHTRRLESVIEVVRRIAQGPPSE
jgi:hypothetical protein